MRRNAGFSLPEIMISLGLSGLVLAGAFSLFASQRNTYQSQNALARRQQELWVALEFVQRDVRKAGMGLGSCVHTAGTVKYPGSVDCKPLGSTPVLEMRPLFVGDGGTANSDSLTITYALPPSNGIKDGTLALPATAWSSNVLTLNDTTTYMTPLGCVCGGTPACTFSTTVPTWALLYNAVDDTRSCSIVKVTNANCTTKQLSIDPTPPPTQLNCQPPQYAAAASTTYNAGESVMNLGNLQQVTYSIDATLAGVPRLMRSVNGAGAQVIAFGVEDLQLVPACDVNGSGLIDPEGATAAAQVTDEWFNNVGGDTIPAACTVFPMMRISMSVRQPAIEGGGLAGQGRAALENHVAGPADGIRRRVLSVIASAPNLAL